MKESEFSRIVSYTGQKYGIDLSTKKTIVEGRLDNYLVRNGFQDYEEYMNTVENDRSGKEAQNLINILTTNHTYFMREFEQFEFLKESVIPELKVREATRKDLRIWSAASSTGEEPYTISMVLKDSLGLEYNSWDTRILATDISMKVLDYAVKGKYGKEQIEPLPESWKRTNFIRLSEEEYQVRQEIRDNIIFRQFNLKNQFPFKSKFHVVFLRNVMIYFDTDTKIELIDKIYDSMEPGGYLFIGGTESIEKEMTQFHYVKPSVFQK